jgi:hypothetical protein
MRSCVRAKRISPLLSLITNITKTDPQCRVFRFNLDCTSYVYLGGGKIAQLQKTVRTIIECNSFILPSELLVHFKSFAVAQGNVLGAV